MAVMSSRDRQTEFFRTVFGDEAGYVFISTMDWEKKRRSETGYWADRSFAWPAQRDTVLEFVEREDTAGRDVYFAVQLYSKPDARRQNLVKSCPSIWSDLDYAVPWQITPEPSVILETSPGRYHGFWRAPTTLTPAEAENLSKRIAYAYHADGADLGGWDLTQVLRIPGTHNHKYEDFPEIRLLKCDPKPIPRAMLESFPRLAETPEWSPGESDGDPPIPLEGDELAHWKLTSPEDRSAWAQRMVAILKEHGLSDRLVESALVDHPVYVAKAAEKWGGKKSAIIDDIHRCIKHWHEHPIRAFNIEIPKNGTGKTHKAEPVDIEDDSTFHQTDYGNAERLVDLYGDDLRYCGPFGQWLVWDGKRFAVDQTEAVVRRAKQSIRAMYTEAADITERNPRVALIGHAKRSEAFGRIKAMVSLAQSEPTVAITPDQIDCDPWLLNVQNGTIDLHTGKLRAHNRADLITKLAPVQFIEGATCPTWDQFLEKVLPSADVRLFVQRAFGYSLTGITTERIVLILYGVGANGKSTFLDIGRALLGDYAMSTTSETFMLKRDGSIPNDIARLRGARFVSAIEAEQGKRLAEAQIKQMAGGADLVSARFMRGEWFDFQPELKVWLATNHKPIIRGTDDGIWDRIRLVSFPVRISEAEQDKALTSKLHAELPGILQWAVHGCLQWQAHGLAVTDEVRQATAEYRAEMDLLGHFIEDRCDIHPDYRECAGPLYKAYGAWCEAGGERPMTQISLGKRLKEMGYQSERDTRNRYWKGLKLRDLGL